MTDSSICVNPEKPKEINYSLSESIFAILFSFSGFFFVKTILFARVGIASAFFMLILAVVSMTMVKMNKAIQTKKSLILFGTALVFALNIAVTSNGLIQFLDLLFAFILFGMWAFSVNNQGFNGADDYLIYSVSSAVFRESFGN
ncbi:MAG: hypothetical protein Q4F95_10625, partial [Oscillospiraceae bacterium]|nr:hypothetical protein [Oscillospiraceae bacterium]